MSLFLTNILPLNEMGSTSTPFFDASFNMPASDPFSYDNDYTGVDLRGSLCEVLNQINRKDNFGYPPVETAAPYMPYEEAQLFTDAYTFSFPPVITVSPKDTCSSPPLDSPSSTSSSPVSGISSLSDCNSESGFEDESDSNDTDEEYTPPVVGSLKRCRSSTNKSYHRSSSATSTSTSTTSVSSSSRSTKRIRNSPPSRNRQADSSMSAAIALTCSVTSADETDFTCPQCPYKQKNRRMPDFKRHLKTHLRASQDNECHGWRCKGVLLEHADEYDIKDLEPYMFLGKQRVGGCRLSFSRRDALKRHLDNVNVGCVGVPSAPDVD